MNHFTIFKCTFIRIDMIKIQIQEKQKRLRTTDSHHVEKTQHFCCLVPSTAILKQYYLTLFHGKSLREKHSPLIIFSSQAAKQQLNKLVLKGRQREILRDKDEQKKIEGYRSLPMSFYDPVVCNANLYYIHLFEVLVLHFTQNLTQMSLFKSEVGKMIWDKCKWIEIKLPQHQDQTLNR